MTIAAQMDEDDWAEDTAEWQKFMKGAASYRAPRLRVSLFNWLMSVYRRFT